MVNYFPSVNQVVLSRSILSLLMVLIFFFLIFQYSDGRNQESQAKQILQANVDPRPQKVCEGECELTSYLRFMSFTDLIASCL